MKHYVSLFSLIAIANANATDLPNNQVKISIKPQTINEHIDHFISENEAQKVTDFFPKRYQHRLNNTKVPVLELYIDNRKCGTFNTLLLRQLTKILDNKTRQDFNSKINHSLKNGSLLKAFAQLKNKRKFEEL